jgi:outer membrane lipoprotein SlyB
MKMEFRKIIVAAAALVAMALAGCATSEQQQRAGTGALLGAGAGALAGQAIGGNTKSTVVGAAGGALLGAAIGTATTPKRRGEELCRYRAPDGSVYTAPCDERYYSGNY